MSSNGIYKELYPWSKFYPDHCEDSVISMMISENVHIKWDEIPDAQDFVDALITIEDIDHRLWLYQEFKEAINDIGEEYLTEYLECEGIDVVFKKMMDDFEHPLSHDLVINMIEYGIDDEDIPLVLGRYYGKFTGEEAENLFTSYNIPYEYAGVIVRERIESLTKDQIEEIMNSIDENLYPAMIPYINKLSFEERMDIMDDFDLDISENMKDKNEPGKLFSGLAMTGAIIEGIRQGINDAKDTKN
ncbi:MAG: hypothetical protein K6B41_06030 [Butyrivibrio sp.]|nr:hypothetical protein [Butyrivibrio sp.]